MRGKHRLKKHKANENDGGANSQVRIIITGKQRRRDDITNIDTADTIVWLGEKLNTV